MQNFLTVNDGRAVVVRYVLFTQGLFLTLKFVWQVLAFPTLLLALPIDWTGVMWHGSFISAAVVFFVMYFLAQIFTTITLGTLHFCRYSLYHWGSYCQDTDEKYPKCPKITAENKHWLYAVIGAFIFAGWFLAILSQAPILITELTLTSGSLWAVALYMLGWFALHAGLDASYVILLRKHLGMDAASYNLKDGEPLPMNHPSVIACEQRLSNIAAIPGVSKLNWALRGLLPTVDTTKLGVVHEFQELESRTGLKVRYARASFDMNAYNVSAVSHAKAAACRSLLSKELDLYPPGFFAKVHLKQIVLCSGVSCAGGEMPGFADVQSESLYLGVPEIDGNFWFKRILHHEVFHLIDFHDDLEGLNDRSWERLNRTAKNDGSDHVRSGEFDVPGGSGEGTGTGTDSAADNSKERVEGTITGGGGFLNEYSRSAVHEDKAEFFSLMMTAYNQVVQLTERDPIIARKFERMKRLVAKVDARFNDEFWLQRAKECEPDRVLDCRPGHVICMK
ncbi:MAG: hypothetical protein K2W95_09985 [Candidatus Obscuribacterales bacterium]|nr:hypothetical protein [Candidatus Obscuribacterales bacterium]